MGLVNHRMQKLFVKGEVTSAVKAEDGIHCLVNITNDGWFVCKQAFIVQDVDDLEEQFYRFLESDEFQRKLRR
jgi:hypothetical protein